MTTQPSFDIDLAIADLITATIIALHNPKTDDAHDEALDNWDNHIQVADYLIGKLQKYKEEEL